MDNFQKLSLKLKGKKFENESKDFILQLIHLYDALNEISFKKKLCKDIEDYASIDKTKTFLLELRINSILSVINKKKYEDKDASSNDFTIYYYDNPSSAIFYCKKWNDTLINKINEIELNESNLNIHFSTYKQKKFKNIKINKLKERLILEENFVIKIIKKFK